jgi:hypothetical protein
MPPRGVEDLEVFLIANLLAGVDVDPDCFHEAQGSSGSTSE